LTVRIWSIGSMALAAVFGFGCSDKAESGPTASGGMAGGSSGAGAGLGGVGPAVAGNGGTPSVAGTSGGGAGGSSGAGASALHFALFNVVADTVERGFDPAPDTLHRVELPPLFTLEARVPAGTVSVRFSVAGKETVDGAEPFRLTEDAQGAAQAWDAAFGSHEVKVSTFATVDGSGAPAEQFTQTIELSAAGMNAAFAPTDQATNDAWVDANLEQVLEPKTFTGSVGMLPYRLYTPEHYDASVKYPVLVYLHGRGPRGYDNEGTYTSQLFHGPQSIVSPNQQHRFPSFVIVPQCGDMPAHQEWAHWVGNSEQDLYAGLSQDGAYTQHAEPFPSALLVKELVASLAASVSIEPDRVYLTGESMGGFGTWEFTTRWPEVFAAGVPMAGYSDRTKVARILEIPFWVFHGDADQSNPVAGSRAMVLAINEAGGRARLTEYAGVDHSGTFSKAWSEETALLPFIYSQRRAR
jgi:poly(3-hydroxybutyrate) depolymerase